MISAVYPTGAAGCPVFDTALSFGKVALPALNSSSIPLNSLMETFLYHVIFMRNTQRRQDAVTVVGYQRRPCLVGADIEPLRPSSLQNLANIQLIGRISDLAITRNSLHMFAAVSRERWELDSRNRFLFPRHS